MSKRNHETGCRPDTLFGLWCIDPVPFTEMVELCRAVPLDSIRAKESTAGADDEPPPKPYENRGGVAVIPLAGPMTKYPTSFSRMVGGTSTVQMRDAIKQAIADADVHSLLLHIESPGGTVAGTQELVTAVLTADTHKPVYAHVEDQGASAAYWVASQARRITANPNARVGSIGAFAALKDTSGMYEQKGVKVHVIASGPYKGAGVDGAKISAEHLAEFQQQIDDVADLFIAGVAKGRNFTAAKARELADGRAPIAAKALKLGMIDAVAEFDDVLASIQREPHQAKHAPPVRGTGGGSFEPATNNHRSPPMPFSAEQLQAIRARPGMADFAKGADDKPDQQFVALGQHLDGAQAAQARATTAEAERDRLRGELEKAQKQGTAAQPKAPPDPEALRDRADLTLGRIDLALERGDMPAAIADKLKSMVRNQQGEPQAFMLSRQDGFNERPIEAILKLFDGAKLGVASQRGANAVALARQEIRDPGGEPDGKALADEGLAEGQAYQERMQRSRGLTTAK